MSEPMKTADPAYWMLLDDYVTIPEIFQAGCYICEDPEFAQMGLPLCKPCLAEGCSGHCAADNPICDDCGEDQYALYMAQNEDKDGL